MHLVPAVVVPGVPQLIIVKHLFSTGFQLEVFTHVVMMLHDAWRLLKKKIGEGGGRRGCTTMTTSISGVLLLE